jgi:hypothetical protein
VYEANPKTTNPGSNLEITGAVPRGDYERPPFENFKGLAAKLLKVPKEEVDEKRAERKKKRRQEETS